MAKALKTIGVIAGAVALVATGLGAAGVAAIGGLSTVGTGASIAGIATVVAGVANIGSQALAKPPPARGSVQQMIVAANAPQPYAMGEGYFAGVRRHVMGYGGTVDGIENPYLFDVVVYSGGGPVQAITPYVDYGAVPAWYSGFLYTDTQLGACPEADALAEHWPGAPGWGASYKLSGQAAIGWSFKFDKSGKKFASGLPVTGAYLQGVKVYDPRLDDTFPGGSGACRLGTESTYVYSDNPALHAGMYGYGRYQNGVRTIGVGLPPDAVDWDNIAAWANVCEANGWTLFGVAFEPGDRWQTLIDIAAAGGAMPIPGPTLAFKYSAPVVALDTIDESDLADGPMSVVAMQSYRDRTNTVVPKYVSPDHNWEMVQAEPVTDATYILEDGEERMVEWAFNFVKSPDQATQLAAYRLLDSRELHPVELQCKPRLRAYRPGDCLHLDLPQLGLDHDAIILRRSIDPATMAVSLTLVTEDSAKHAFALGLTGAAPPAPTLTSTPEDRDTVAGASSAPTEDEVTAPVTGTVQASEALSAGDFVNVWSSGGAARMRKADATDPAKAAHGFVPAAVASGASGSVRFGGLNSAVTVASTDDEVWLSETVPGGFQATPPTTAGYIQQSLGVGIPGLGIYFTRQTPVEV